MWTNIKPKEITYMGYAEAAEGKLVGGGATTEVNVSMLQNNHGQHLDTMMWALQLNQSEGVKIHFQTSAERKRWKAEFYPKMVKAVSDRSSNPSETLAMIKKIEALVDDLRWQ